ncbi:M24 family metallopeptidase [Candidatus Rariloculus sp.]|uniref:M24 family metallopeptidase n=1 Tax=Candidatus Rariloculus sp. TaxID=3101265 RepID=UPI003D14EF10
MTANLAAADAAVRRESLHRRHAAVRGLMQQDGIEVLIAYGSGLHAFTGTNPAWYLAGFKQIGPHAAVILPIDGDPALVLTPRWDHARYLERATMESIAVAPEDFLDTVAGELRKRGLLGKRVAVAGGQLQPRETSAAWEGLLGQAPLSAEKLISDTAKIRDEWSLLCVRRAAGIAERGYANLLATARPGMPEYIIAADLEVFMRELGAEDNFQLLSASQRNQAGHFPTNRILGHGDVMLAEITPAVEGEFVQICRTTVFGKPSALQLEKFALLDTALRGGLRAATPGTSVTEIVAAINEPIAAAGYERYTKPPYMRTRGHSMGLGSMEPELMPGHAHFMHTNMVFVMHPNQYIPETGYLMCGEPVIITEEGAVPLTGKMGTLGSIV